MARFDDEFRERIREVVDMVELLRGQVQMTRRGGRWWGRCPFHDERSPSFTLIPPENQRYFCHGCGATGDAFTWMIEREGAAHFADAVEALSERFGIPLPQDASPADQRDRAARARREELLERAAAYYSAYLWSAEEAEPARRYLLGRGFSEDLLRRYRVGYAPGSGSALAGRAVSQGFSREQLADAGLGRGGGGRGQDFFVSRITFPIATATGKVQGFGARTLDPDERAKYVNSPDGRLFKKRHLLFGLSLARRAASRQGWIVVAEGYTDVLALAQVGVEAAVACMGTSLTTEQLRVLARAVGDRGEVRLSFDGDRAGQQAAWRSVEAARTVPVRLAALTLPSGQDPGDLVASPEEQAELRRIVELSEPLVPCLIRYRVRSADPSATGRERALQEVIEMLRRLPDSVEKDEGVRVAAGELKLSRGVEERLWEESRHRPVRAEASAPRGALGPQDELERSLLALAMGNPGSAAAELANVWPEAFGDEEHRRVHALLVSGRCGAEEWPEEMRPLWAELAARAAEIDGGERALREGVYRVQLPALERRARELAEKGEETGYLEVLALMRRLKAATRGEAQ